MPPPHGTPLPLRLAWLLCWQAVRTGRRRPAQVTGRDGTRIMAATLTWLMQADGARPEVFPTHLCDR